MIKFKKIIKIFENTGEVISQAFLFFAYSLAEALFYAIVIGAFLSL